MTGVIWTVQRVHYALFSQVGKDGWKTYPAGHTRRTTGVTLGPMIVELASAGWLALRPGAEAGRTCRAAHIAGRGFWVCFEHMGDHVFCVCAAAELFEPGL